ncbi:hypothetical protein [Roseiconus lacunae]|uniref:Uncharacterized protein n=1 Tax=Roseiconus lacunae TaxID=2605694 RepID=A0ABT7PEP2_9BACT|nr:hypothetical protein [Roseiconus lacunae]MDM4014957.1 hypothetical protein [Roseiconus lacunae]
MSRFDEQKRQKFIETVDVRMSQASSQLAAFSQSVSDVYANWLGYKSLESDQTELTQASVAFAGKARGLVDDRKIALAHALDIIAGGMIDGEGEPLTRQDLLDELAAIPAVE